MADQCAPDIRVAEIAARQHGVISVAQLYEAGLSKSSILKRRRAGRLHSLHRGVYAVGHLAPNNERRWMAAVLASGSGAVLSHRSAAALWELLPPPAGPVDVSVPGRSGRRRRQGIRIHRPVSLEPQETSRQSGIPITSPARTLADLQAVAPARELRRAVRQADFLGLPVGPNMERDGTRSELERRFLWLCRRHHLPRPTVNIRLGWMTVDFCWEEQKLVVETDGYRSHGGREAFENDRARDLELRRLGYEVIRLSHRQVFQQPNRVVIALRSALNPATGAR